jgi:hypothetical protein
MSVPIAALSTKCRSFTHRAAPDRARRVRGLEWTCRPRACAGSRFLGTGPSNRAIRTLFKAIAVTFAGALALAVLLYYVLVVVNWRDREPSELSVRMTQQYQQRSPVPDADNGYVYLGAFAAAPEADRGADDPVIARYRKVCPSQVSAECADAFVHGDEVYERWISIDGELLQRYSELIARPGWLETGPIELAAPIPPYRRAVDGQRLALLHARRLVRERNYAAAHRLLESDLRFWRRVLESSDTLIAKMIATAALNRHFELGNLLLRDLDPPAAVRVMPAGWRIPITDSERSMRRCLVGEWLFASSMAKSLDARYRPEVAKVHAEQDGHSGRLLLATVARPFYQSQDSINRYAEQYSHIGELLDVPLGRYQQARANAAGFEARTREDAWPPRSLYNVLGSWLRSQTSTDFSSYAVRVADIEGVRRAALAAMTLRAAQVDPADVDRALETSEFRNPYHGRPFTWSAQDSAICFVGLTPGERGVHLLYY